SVITKLVDLIGPHDHLNPIFVPKCDGSWRVDYCVIMLVFKAGGIPSRHTSEGDRRAVRTDMWILSVVRIEVFSMYWYDYMKKIVLRRADLNEHIIAERDFKYMYPCDFEDLYLLNLQVIDSPRAVTFQDKYGVQMIMRSNEIYKFSDDTLHQIDEALDYRVKKFKVNRMNPGLNTRFWTRKDVDRSKEFMFTIQKRRQRGSSVIYKALLVEE
nr:hypothetical protein [Tanacetum cinerariifolium]